ncbi:MAG TPA: hypothetical protein VJ919_19015 [Tangfeifania sp.]|nr:hypothetical protein [Tangfeifania sp.]
METINKISEVFNVFHSKESYFEEMDRKKSARLIYKQIFIICLFGFIYGLVMGSYHSFLQALVAGIKVMLLFIATLLICFPSFYIIQQILGSKLKFKQMILIILSGFVLASTITLSFAPVIIFFQITGENYHFLQLLHVAVFIFAGIFGMKLIVGALKFACDKKNIYPQIGVTVFRVWVIILAFVGIQLAWSLRPFLSDKNEDFKLFRKYQGNFYTAIIYSFDQLISGSEVDLKEENAETEIVPNQQKDSADFSYFLEK